MTTKEINKRIKVKGLRKDYIARIIGVSLPEFSQAIHYKRKNDTCVMIIEKLKELLK